MGSVELRWGLVGMLNFNFTTPNEVGFNVHMKGPILAATFRF